VGSRAEAALGRLLDAAASGALDDLCRRHGVVLLVAFGSAADRLADVPVHDLDLAVLLDRDTEPNLYALVGDLMDLSDFGDIDILDLGHAGPVARAEALVATEPLYEQLPGLFAEQQVRAMLRRMDTRWLRQLDLELMGG
jgi:predicted nucleotidyltransferase